MTVDEYIASLPEDRQAHVRHLHDVLSAAVPDLEAKVWDYSGQLIGYGTYHYRSKTAEGDWFILGLANRKNYISLHAPAVRDGKYLPEWYLDRLPGVKIGKSCINIMKPELLDDAVLTELARETAELLRQYSEEVKE
jgi:hypothetical protein